MLEIFLLVYMGKHLAKTARAKGHTGAWATLGVLGWIVGEIMGFIVGAAMGMELGAYALALVGAALGAAVGFVVVHFALPDNAHKPLDMEELENTFR